MKIENEYYVLTHCEDLYLTEKYVFDNDITKALKAKNMLTAGIIRESIEIKYKIHLDIIPLKVTYEW